MFCESSVGVECDSSCSHRGDRLCLGIIIALPASTPSDFKNTASYAFGGYANRGYPLNPLREF